MSAVEETYQWIRDRGELFARALMPTLFAEFVSDQSDDIQAKFRRIQAPDTLTVSVGALLEWLEEVRFFAVCHANEYWSPGFTAAAGYACGLLHEDTQIVSHAMFEVETFLTNDRKETLLARFERRREAYAEEQLKEFIREREGATS